MQDAKLICSIINEKLLENVEVQGGGIDDLQKRSNVNREKSVSTEKALVSPCTDNPIDAVSISENAELVEGQEAEDSDSTCEVFDEGDIPSSEAKDDDLHEEDETVDKMDLEHNNGSAELEIEENGEAMENKEEFTVDDIIEETSSIVVCRPENHQGDVVVAENNGSRGEQIETERRARREFAYKLSNLETLPIRKSDNQMTIEGLLEECGVTETSEVNLDRTEGVEVVSLTATQIVQKLAEYGCDKLDLSLLMNNGVVSRKANKLFIIAAGDVSLYSQGDIDSSIKCDYITAYAYLQLHAIGIKVQCPVILLNDRMGLRGGYQA